MDKDLFLELKKGKIEDVVLELEKLSSLYDEKANNSDQSESQRLYEGMAIAYTNAAMKLKSYFSDGEGEPVVTDELYYALGNTIDSLETNSPEQIVD